MDNSTRLVGDAWQKWATQLVMLRHQHSGGYQPVPDGSRGDAGIEGFAVAEGFAYQMYGPETITDLKDEYKRFRVKIKNDIDKFISKKEVLSKILGSTRICRWILLVPRFQNKEILEYASVRTDDVLAASLKYVSPDFRVFVWDEESFAKERSELLRCPLTKVEIDLGQSTNEQMTDWADDNDELVRKLESKLLLIETLVDEEDRRDYRDVVIKDYLNGQLLKEEFRKYPIFYESWAKIKGAFESRLSSKCLLSHEGNAELLTSTLSEMEQHLQRDMNGVSQSNIIAMTHEAVADWLMRCPLEPRRRTN